MYFFQIIEFLIDIKLSAYLIKFNNKQHHSFLPIYSNKTHLVVYIDDIEIFKSVHGGSLHSKNRRKQMVKIEEFIFQLIVILSGVKQGTIWGLFYFLYT